MRFLLVLFMLAIGLAPLGAQDYRARSGETVLKIAIEGRGNVYVRLYTKEAPRATAHVMSLARSGFYDGLRFHRVSKNPRPYLVQTGDPSSRNLDMDDPDVGRGGSGAKIGYEESGYVNEKGAVGLAMEGGQGDSQFYMLLDHARFLDKKHTVFGRVIQGQDVLARIEKGDRITSVSVLQGD